MLGGFVLVGFGLFQFVPSWLSARTTKWPQVSGTVLGHDTRRYWRKPRRYGPIVEYAFTVADRDFRGDTVSYRTTEFRSRKDAMSFCVNEYPIGSQVVVYYDPADPTNAVLRKEDPEWGFAAMFTLAGVVMVLFARRRG